MTFQRRTAGRIIDLVRALKPSVKVVVGGYDPSLASEAYEGMDVDFIVRGEGEVTFRELLRALEQGGDFDGSAAFRAVPVIGGSTTLTGRYIGWKTMRSACLIVRHACSKATRLLGRQVDVIETSRGCTYDCSFCSIIEMRGRNFHTYTFETGPG